MVKSKKKVAHIAEDITKNLTPRQIEFCLLYAFDKDCFGNSTRAYMRAYNLKDSQRKAAQANSSRMILNDIVKRYLNNLYEERFNHEDMDRRHSQLVFQNKNLVVSLGALQEYNKVKKRLEEAPVTHVTFSWKGDNRPKKPIISIKTAGDEQNPEDRPKTAKGKFKLTINK